MLVGGFSIMMWTFFWGWVWNCEVEAWDSTYILWSTATLLNCEDWSSVWCRPKSGLMECTHFSNSLFVSGIDAKNISTSSEEEFKSSLRFFPWNKISWSFPMVKNFKKASNPISSLLKKEPLDNLSFSYNSSLSTTRLSLNFSSSNSSNSSKSTLSFKGISSTNSFSFFIIDLLSI